MSKQNTIVIIDSDDEDQQPQQPQSQQQRNDKEEEEEVITLDESDNKRPSSQRAQLSPPRELFELSKHACKGPAPSLQPLKEFLSPTDRWRRSPTRAEVAVRAVMAKKTTSLHFHLQSVLCFAAKAYNGFSQTTKTIVASQRAAMRSPSLLPSSQPCKLPKAL